MARFEMRCSDVEKETWREKALQDGFPELSPWLRWLANTHTSVTPSTIGAWTKTTLSPGTSSAKQR